MAYLQPEILPAMAEAIHRQLRAARARRLSRAEIAARLLPPALEGRRPMEAVFAATLAELRGIGALSGDDDGLTLPDDVAGAAEPGAMRRIVLQKAAAEGVEDFWVLGDDGALALTGARDLVRAFAWFLALDVRQAPYAFEGPRRSLAALQQEQLRARVIHNIERWRPFQRWARYLGLAREVGVAPAGARGAALLPDPTPVVRAELPACVMGDDWTPLSDVAEALGRRVPLLDRGRHRRAIHERGAPAPAGDLSSSLTLALRRLEAEGAVALQRGAGDAPKLTLADDQGAYHALRWTGAGDA